MSCVSYFSDFSPGARAGAARWNSPRSCLLNRSLASSSRGVTPVDPGENPFALTKGICLAGRESLQKSLKPHISAQRSQVGTDTQGHGNSRSVVQMKREGAQSSEGTTAPPTGPRHQRHSQVFSKDENVNDGAKCSLGSFTAGTDGPPRMPGPPSPALGLPQPPQPRGEGRRAGRG